MRTGLASAVISAALGLCSGATAQAVDPREAAIREVIDQIWSGWETGDRSLVEPNLSSDFIDTDFDGTRRERAEVLAFLGTPTSPPPRVVIETSDHRFRFHGQDAAVVTYRTTDCRAGANGDRCIRFVATDAFVFERGAWRLASGQQTLIPASGEAEAAQAEVEAAEAAVDRAQIDNDPEGFGQLTTADWTFTTGDGAVVSRTQFQADMRAFWKPEAIDRTERVVRLMRDGAVVSGIVSYRWIGRDGVMTTATERYTDVYSRDFGRWRKTATHVSCISGAC